jgi:signal peptidase I
LTCCNAQGEISVNGVAINESQYLYPGDKPSQAPFSVILKPGTIWLMGDHRSISLDSQAWGPIALSDIVGRVVMITPAGGRTTFVSPPQTFVSTGLAPAGSAGIPAPIVLIVIAVAGLIAAIVIGVVGIVRSSARQSRSRRAAGPPPGPGQYVV